MECSSQWSVGLNRDQLKPSVVPNQHSFGGNMDIPAAQGFPDKPWIPQGASAGLAEGRKGEEVKNPFDFPAFRQLISLWMRSAVGLKCPAGCAGGVWGPWPHKAPKNPCKPNSAGHLTPQSMKESLQTHLRWIPDRIKHQTIPLNPSQGDIWPHKAQKNPSKPISVGHLTPQSTKGSLQTHLRCISDPTKHQTIPPNPFEVSTWPHKEEKNPCKPTLSGHLNQ